MNDFDLTFSILWEEMKENMAKADLYRKRIKMIQDGKKFRTLLKDKQIGEYLGTDRSIELAKEQDKHFKKTMFYSGLLKAMERDEENEKR